MTHEQMTALVKLQAAYQAALSLMESSDSEYAEQLINWQEAIAQDQMDDRIEDLDYTDE